MKIAVLHSSYDGSTAPFRDFDAVCDPSRFLPDAETTHFNIAKAQAWRQVTEIAGRGFDVAINLCDGARDEDRAGIEVVQALEQLNMAFTGAGSRFYDPSREAMKMACHSAGVAFPAYVIARRLGDVERAVSKLRFPMIVKHPQGYASVGLTRDSVVNGPETLRIQAARMIAEFGAALIEEFIEGREFTVLVTEARDESEPAWALEPVEFRFPQGESFKHFDLKWQEFESMQATPVPDAKLARRLKESSALTFAALGGSGYGRCDIRVDAGGRIFVLEINPNCGVFYPEDSYGSADFILAADPAGHRGFLNHLIACALRRRDREQRGWELQFTPGLGFGMFALRTLRAGEVAVRYEEQPHTMVSRRRVEREWRGLRRMWFDQYAWPVTAGLHVMWSDNPDDWRPVNHSCDPNTWLDGLDLVVRRDIMPGEELTVDYATFCGPAMSPFECRCGASDCRQAILGSDHLLPRLHQKYGDHVSDFVRGIWHNTSPDWRPAYEIVQNSFGLGLVARRAWLTGEEIVPLVWRKRSDEPSRWTVQIGEAEHAEPEPFELRYVNHSCSPNVAFDIEAGVLRAFRDIEPGDELRYFYPSTEWELAEPFACRCGTPDCLGSIHGASRTLREALERNAPADFIRRRLGLRVEAKSNTALPRQA
jgi:D-alanine-D-alanine ligase